MDAKRLEELVYRCNEAIEDTSNGFGAYLEHTGNHTWCIVSYCHGFTLGTAWAGEYDPKLTAIEAVEAAQEVEP